MADFEVSVGAGSLRTTAPAAIEFPHSWTDEGVTVEAPFTGAHLLLLAAAGCVLNDVYREAGHLGVAIDGVRVTASGDYDRETWRSTGISYVVELDSVAAGPDLAELLAVVDEVAEIPKAIRQGAAVGRVEL